MTSRRTNKRDNKLDYDTDELYENEEEKEKILALPEFERERILDEKLQK